MSGGSLAARTQRIGPPHLSQVSTSARNTCRKSHPHRERRERGGVSSPSVSNTSSSWSPEAGSGVERPGSASQSAGTTRLRCLEWLDKTPKWRTMLNQGGGIAAQSRTSRSWGSSVKACVPSFQTFLSVSSSRPSARHSSRS